MMYEDLLDFLFVFSHGLLAYYIMLLIEFREPKGRWQLIWVILNTLLLTLTGLTYVVFGKHIYRLSVVFTLTIPATFIAIWCSRYKGLRVVFNICTSLYIGCIAFSVSAFVQALFSQNLSLIIAARLITYIILYLIVWYLRPYYHRMLQLLDRGWGILCAIPTATFLTALYILNFVIDKYPLYAAVAITGITLLCTCSYILIYLFFTGILKEFELRKNRDIMDIQLTSLKHQSETSRRAEEEIQLQRRNMNRRWEEIAEMIQQGNEEAVLQLAGRAGKQLDKTVSIHRCENNMINAMFSAYIAQAGKEGITIETELNISDSPPVDSAELAMVLANALENAINACADLPEAQRRIICRCTDTPILLIQIENPCSGKIRFDSQGLPVTSEKGHGLSTRSISAFCKKYGAVPEYRVEKGRFCIRISL